MNTIQYTNLCTKIKGGANNSKHTMNWLHFSHSFEDVFDEGNGELVRISSELKSPDLSLRQEKNRKSLRLCLRLLPILLAALWGFSLFCPQVAQVSCKRSSCGMAFFKNSLKDSNSARLVQSWSPLLNCPLHPVALDAMATLILPAWIFISSNISLHFFCLFFL